jgi:prepilin-type N-terminal cleavage/methylation domain-containing protein
MKTNGFTLLEVLVALLILTAAVTIFSSTQLRSLLRVSKERQLLDRAFIVKSNLFDFIEQLKDKDNKKKNLKKTLEDPQVKIVSEIIDIDKKSKLKKFAGDISIVKTEGEWQNFGSNYNLSFVTFIEKEKKKSS